jgi:hypothetical protein
MIREVKKYIYESEFLVWAMGWVVLLVVDIRKSKGKRNLDWEKRKVIGAMNFHFRYVVCVMITN